MRTTRWVPVLMLVMPLAAVFAATLPTEPYSAANFTVSLPSSWTVAEDAKNGTVVARQNGRRDDSAAVLFFFRTAEPNVTADQLLDRVGSQFAKNLMVRSREGIPGGGYQMVADGMSGTNQVRVGVVAVVTNGVSVVSLLVARTGAFDALGGMELVTNIMASFRVRNAAAPASPPSALAPPGSGRLDVPPLARPPTFADLAGGWGNDDSVVTNYVSYRGDYAGYQSIATKEKWVFDGKGNVSSAFTANVAGQGTARQVNERKKGTVVLSPGNVMTMAWIGAAPASFVIRGWRELPGMTVLLLNGPWYGQVPADVLGDRRIGGNLNSYWVRTAR